MGTPFSDIYVGASFRFTDYEMLEMDFSQRFQILSQYLKMAEADFAQICPFDLNNKNYDEGCYNDVLDPETVEILSLGVAYYWLSRKLMDSDLFINPMSTKEYSYFSDANMLKAMHILKSDIFKEYKQKIIDYSYYNGGISSLEVGR